MPALVKFLDTLHDLVAGHRDHETQQGFQQRDGRDRGRKELRRVHGHCESVLRVQDDRAGRAVGNADDGHALVTGDTHRFDHLCPVGLHRHGNQHIAPVGPGQVVRRGRSGLRNAVKLRHAGGRQIGEIAGIGVVDAHTQRKHLPRGPDRLGRGLQRILGNRGEGFLDVARRRIDHVGVKPADFAGLADILQPSRPVRETDSALADGLSEGRAKIVIALEPHLSRHAHECVGLHVRRLGDFAHCRDAHIGGVFQNIACGLLRLGGQAIPLVTQAVKDGV